MLIFDKTPRNLVSLQHHSQTRKNSSLKLTLSCKEAVVSFVFLRRKQHNYTYLTADYQTQQQQSNQKSDRLRNKVQTYFICELSDENSDVQIDMLNEINQIQSQIANQHKNGSLKEFSDKTPSSGMGSDMIQKLIVLLNLRLKIQKAKLTLKYLYTQNKIELCYQQLEQQIQQKLRTSNSNLSRQNMYNNRSGHQRHRSKRGSGDYDQVIIEEEEYNYYEEEDQQTQDNNNNDESKFNGEISIVAAANNQGDPNQQDQSTNMLEDLSMLRKLSLEINRNYEKFAELRKSLNIFGGGGTKSNNTTQGQMQLESSGFNTNGYNSNSNVTPTPIFIGIFILCKPNSNKNGGSSNQPQNTIQNIIRKSLNFNNQPVINNQNLTSNFVELGSQVSIAADIERQFRLLVDQKNKEKIVIEEALLNQKHNLINFLFKNKQNFNGDLQKFNFHKIKQIRKIRQLRNSV